MIHICCCSFRTGEGRWTAWRITDDPRTTEQIGRDHSSYDLETAGWPNQRRANHSKGGLGTLPAVCEGETTEEA